MKTRPLLSVFRKKLRNSLKGANNLPTPNWVKFSGMDLLPCHHPPPHSPAEQSISQDVPAHQSKCQLAGLLQGSLPVPVKLPVEKAKGPHVACREGGSEWHPCSLEGLLHSQSSLVHSCPRNIKPGNTLLLKELHPVNPEARKQTVHCSPSSSFIGTSPGKIPQIQLEKDQGSPTE